MALIARFKPLNKASGTFRSEVECGWAITERGGRRLLHLETYGSSSRQIPGKISQSLQLDETAARKLRDLIDQAFPR